MTALRLVLLLLLFVCYCRAREDCRSFHNPRHFTIVPSNVECLADYIYPDAEIRKTEIYFKAKNESELLLRVPIETPESAIAITVGIDRDYLIPGGYEMKFVLHDYNSFFHFDIADEAYFFAVAPCYFEEVESEHGTLVSEGTKPSSTYKFTFLPWKRLGCCETAQEGGYVNVGKFRDQLNPFLPLYLELNSFYGGEEFSIHYISIESI